MAKLQIISGIPLICWHVCLSACLHFRYAIVLRVLSAATGAIILRQLCYLITMDGEHETPVCRLCEAIRYNEKGIVAQRGYCRNCWNRFEAALATG